MFDIKKSFMVISFIIIILVTVTGSVVTSSGEQSLNITNWIVESNILENGDLEITEDITFNFKGKYNGVFREVILENTSGITGIKIAEVDGDKVIEYEKVENAKKGDSNVFLIDRKDNDVTFQVFSPSRDEKKTFRMIYTIKNVAKRYNDTGELFYKFLGEQNDTPIDLFFANITLPQEDTDNRVRMFAHGPLNGEIHKTTDNTINLRVGDVPKNTFIEARILFPEQFIPASQNIINRDAFSDIMNEEAQLQEGTQQGIIKKEARGALFGNIAVILSAVEVLIFIFFLTKYRRLKDIHEESKYSEIPDDNTPAVISYVTGTTMGGNTIIATLLDLYRKGYIKISGGEEFKKRRKVLRDFTITKTKEEDNNLLSHEKHFIGWLIDIMGDGKTVTTEDIKNYSKNKRSMFMKYHNNWMQLIREDADNKGYFDKSTKKYGLLLIILFPLGLMLSIVSLINDNLLGLPLIFTSVLMLFQGIMLLSRKSDYGHEQHKKWMEFKKHMKRIKKDDSRYDLDRYPKGISLIYGLVFGIDNDVLNELNVETLHREDAFSYSHGWLYWYFIFNSSGSNAFSNSINNSFGSTVSSTGMGGGFTGGGGGGAGGGGAGGF
ncbi:MAG: DUF2207 domain-containing protein [Natronincolaceae bacterium]|nr:DUF2207 domain-containing protein [Bacillota bacterium]